MEIGIHLETEHFRDGLIILQLWLLSSSVLWITNMNPGSKSKCKMQNVLLCDDGGLGFLTSIFVISSFHTLGVYQSFTKDERRSNIQHPTSNTLTTTLTTRRQISFCLRICFCCDQLHSRVGLLQGYIIHYEKNQQCGPAYTSIKACFFWSCHPSSSSSPSEQ